MIIDYKNTKQIYVDLGDLYVTIPWAILLPEYKDTSLLRRTLETKNEIEGKEILIVNVKSERTAIHINTMRFLHGGSEIATFVCKKGEYEPIYDDEEIKTTIRDIKIKELGVYEK